MASAEVSSKHPLAEVFGFKTTDRSSEAKSHRSKKLCPFNNLLPECTKDKKDDPLAVCSINYNDSVTIICPVRFREKWKICKDAAEFLFAPDVKWTPLKEIRLKEKTGDSAGNIDLVLAAHDENGKISDFGTVEVQAVYVSGNIRRPFEHYMSNPEKNENMDWTKEKNYPRPDYLSSSRKRLAPQLLYKGQILNTWGKKQVVVVDRPFFDTLPDLPTISPDKAEMCWLVYELKDSKSSERYELKLDKKLYTGFEPVMKQIANPEVGDVKDFIESLEKKLAPVLAELKEKYGVSSLSELLKREQSSNQSEKTRSDEISL